MEGFGSAPREDSCLVDLNLETDSEETISSVLYSCTEGDECQEDRPSDISGHQKNRNQAHTHDRTLPAKAVNDGHERGGGAVGHTYTRWRDKGEGLAGPNLSRTHSPSRAHTTPKLVSQDAEHRRGRVNTPTHIANLGDCRLPAGVSTMEKEGSSWRDMSTPLGGADMAPFIQKKQTNPLGNTGDAGYYGYGTGDVNRYVWPGPNTNYYLPVNIQQYLQSGLPPRPPTSPVEPAATEKPPDVLAMRLALESFKQQQKKEEEDEHLRKLTQEVVQKTMADLHNAAEEKQTEITKAKIVAEVHAKEHFTRAEADRKRLEESALFEAEKKVQAEIEKDRAIREEINREVETGLRREERGFRDPAYSERESGSLHSPRRSSRPHPGRPSITHGNRAIASENVINQGRQHAYCEPKRELSMFPQPGRAPSSTDSSPEHYCGALFDDDTDYGQSTRQLSPSNREGHFVGSPPQNPRGRFPVRLRDSHRGYRQQPSFQSHTDRNQKEDSCNPAVRSPPTRPFNHLSATDRGRFRESAAGTESNEGYDDVSTRSPLCRSDGDSIGSEDGGTNSVLTAFGNTADGHMPPKEDLMTETPTQRHVNEIDKLGIHGVAGPGNWPDSEEAMSKETRTLLEPDEARGHVLRGDRSRRDDSGEEDSDNSGDHQPLPAAPMLNEIVPPHLHRPADQSRKEHRGHIEGGQTPKGNSQHHLPRTSRDQTSPRHRHGTHHKSLPPPTQGPKRHRAGRAAQEPAHLDNDPPRYPYPDSQYEPQEAIQEVYVAPLDPLDYPQPHPKNKGRGPRSSQSYLNYPNLAPLTMVPFTFIALAQLQPTLALVRQPPPRHRTSTPEDFATNKKRTDRRY